MKYLLSLSAILIALNSFAQVDPTPGTQRLQNIGLRQSLEANSLVKNIQFRNIGPTIMSGRVVDLEVNPADPTEFYVAYATGGLWHTINNGQSFTPLFDNEDVITIGDFDVDWKSRTIWIGTGESNSSRSSYSGVGMYMSADSGKTWIYKGLPESHHIGKVLISPKDANTIFVAALGHLYSPNKDRGIYKTTDGGKTWKQVLYIDENTGAIDLSFVPGTPEKIYASMWHRERRAWNLIESGSSSGIYLSEDNGDKWTKLNVEGAGFPNGNETGRIGLTIFPKNPSVIYAVVDNQAEIPDTAKKDTSVIDPKELKTISKENFLKLNDKKLGKFLSNYGFPEKYTAENVKDLVKKDSIKPSDLSEYLNDANNSLFQSPTIGMEVYRSDNGGKSWKKTNEKSLKNLGYTYGYYFGKIFVSPNDENTIVVCGLPILKSEDGGKTFKSIDGDNTHGDHHAVWMNPEKNGHIIIGNDGGINISYDWGKSWFKANTPAVGQFYSVNVDNEKPYNVFGGLQDNGVWMGSSETKPNTAWTQEGQYPFKSIMGGDGMQVQVDTRDNANVYTGFQFGNYYRINVKTEDVKSITPQNDIGEKNFRFNWQTPIWLSKHNQDILYLGSNRFHRSMSKADTWETLSDDLTKSNKTGDVPFNTITTIHESSRHFGHIYIGTDDGFVWKSKDAGSTWTKISDGLPQDLYVSRVIASSHKDGRVYVSLNGYRNDNFHPYIYSSEDDGKTWINISSGLPDEPVNVVREDDENENLLFAGTDNGLYVSLNKGKTWMSMKGNLPRVPVHDMVIQSREKEIVLGTHGRSIYIGSIAEVRQMDSTLLNKELVIFAANPPKYSDSWGKLPQDFFSEHTLPEMKVSYYSRSAGVSNFTIKDKKGGIMFTAKDSTEAGLNYFAYNLLVNEKAKAFKSKSTIEKAEDGNLYLPEGDYTIEITRGDAIVKSEFKLTKGEDKKETSPEAREKM